MAENIFTTEEPDSEDTIGGQGQNDGMKWRTTTSGKVITRGRIWISAAGKPTGLRWQLWTFAPSGASTLERNVLCDELPFTLDAWMEVPTTSFSPEPNTDYIVSRWIPGGGPHPYSGSGGPITNGSISATAIYDTDVPHTSPPQFEGFSSGLLFADIFLEDPGETEPDVIDIGWTPKVGRHCVYLQQVTVDGNNTYVKRRPAIITALGAGDLVNIRIGHSGETYTNVDRKRDPNDNAVGVYVSY